MLSPQHFQQLERWVHAEVRGHSGAATSFGYGFTALEFDQGALAGGQIAVTHCAGILQDGTAFDCPGRDPLPAARDAVTAIGERQALTVFLALPEVTPGASAFTDGDGLAPFTTRRERLTDLNRPESAREIGTASLRLELRFEGESMAGYRTIPIARLTAGAGGGVSPSSDFMPPAVRVAAAPIVTSVLRQVLGMVSQKWNELAGKRRGGGGGMAESAGILLLHTVGESLPLLRHCLDHGATPPVTAHLCLGRLMAQLCTFHGSKSPMDVPGYVHDNAGPGFAQLAEGLQELLGDAAPSRCAELPIEREGETMFAAKIPSPDMLTSNRLFLAVRADAPEEEVQTRFPTLVKISSKDRIQELLIRAVPGLPVRVVPQPPPAIPVQSGRSYFALEPTGEHWEAITASLTLAIHASPGLAQLHIELLAVKE